MDNNIVAKNRMRCYLDVVLTSDKSAEELDKEIEYWDKRSRELDHWIDPDLPDE